MFKTKYDEIYEKNKGMVNRIVTILLGIGTAVGFYQYQICKISKEIVKLEAEKSQLETENSMLKKMLFGEYKVHQAYIEKNKEIIELPKIK